MKPENLQIMKLLLAHIMQHDDVEIVKNADWSQVMEIAKRQNILSMICDRLLNLPEDSGINAKEARTLYLAMMKQVYLNSKKFIRAENMMELISENGIKTVALKGCVVRDLYPVPEWRTMGDIDVLISKTDMPLAKSLYEENGYSVSGSLNREIACSKDKNFTWEIKCSLEAEFPDNYEKIDALFLSSDIRRKHGVFRPSDTMLLLHIIAHTSKNLLSIGAGIRNLCDIVLCVSKNTNTDFKSIKDACIKYGHLKIYNALMSCAHYYFDVDISNTGAELISEEKAEGVIEYMMSEGIYGVDNSENRIANWTLRNDDSISPLRKIFFPSLKLMRRPYPYLKKYPFLLPAAWVQRAYNAIVTQGIPIGQMIRGAGKSIDMSNEHDKQMRRLGLK